MREEAGVIPVIGLLLGAMVGLGATAMAAPPANDDFADAIVLSGMLPITDPNGTNVEASEEAGEPLPDPTGTTAWWRWTATEAKRICFQTGGVAETDTVLSVFTGASLAGLTLVETNDDDPGLGRASKVTLMASPGTTYHLQVGGFRGEEGPFTVTVAEAPPPPDPPDNDDFADAEVLSGALPIVVSGGTNGNATEEAGEPLPEDSLRTVWWRWTPTSTGWVHIETGGAAGTDTVLGVFRGSTLNDLQLYSFNDDGDSIISPASEVEVYAEAGTTYHIQVGGYEGEEGAFTLTLENAAARPVVIGITATPSPVDVMGAPVAVQVDISASYGPGLADGRIFAAAPGGVGAGANAPFDASNRIAGTAANGTYRVTLDLQRFIPPGDYVLELELNGVDDVEAEYVPDAEFDSGGSEFGFPNGVTTTLPVINNGPVGAYGAWLTRYPTLQGADALRSADPERDGFTNLEELVFGLNPTLNSRPGGPDPNAGNAPQFSVNGNRIELRYKIILDDLGAFSPIAVIPQRSSNLIDWIGGVRRLINGIGDFTAIRDIVVGEADYLRVAIGDPLAP